MTAVLRYFRATVNSVTSAILAAFPWVFPAVAQPRDIPAYSDSWVSAGLVPTPVTGAPSTYTATTQPGSRIILVDPVDGEMPTSQAAAYDLLLFSDGAKLVDRYGNANNPASGLPYGTDALNPGPGARAFKSLAGVMHKAGASFGPDDLWGFTLNFIGYGNHKSLRHGYPDWTLIRRGTTVSVYDDIRAWLDFTGRSTMPIDPNMGTLHAGCGSAAGKWGVLGAYGPLSAGRARIVDPVAGYLSFTATADKRHDHAIVFGLMFDGRVRETKIRPSDYGLLTHLHLQAQHGGHYNGAGKYATNQIVEDCMWLETGEGWGPAFPNHHKVKNATVDVTQRRCIVADIWHNYPDASDYFAIFERGAAAADQTVAANTSAVLTYTNTVGAGSKTPAPSPAAGTFTVPVDAAAEYLALLAVNVTGTVGVGGGVTIGLFVSGVAAQSKTLAGTGVAGDTYAFRGALRSIPALAVGDTLELRITSTGATSPLSVKGGGASRVYLGRNIDAFCSGGGASVSPAGRFTVEDTIIIRAGFGVSPASQASWYPNAADPRYRSFPRNHSWYSVGDTDTGTFVVRYNAMILGAAGELFRNDVEMDGNFFFGGYVQVNPEHNYHPYAEVRSNVTRNVLQVYRQYVGDVTAHPGWGFDFGNGSIVRFADNIVSHAHPSCNGTFGPGAWGQYAIKVSHCDTPYLGMESVFKAPNDTLTDAVGNILDSLDPRGVATSSALYEVNGVKFRKQAFLSPVSGWSADPAVNLTGVTVTCIPRAGYVGDPVYSWVRAEGQYADQLTVIAGANSPTYTLTAADWTPWVNSGDVAQTTNILKVYCQVDGIQYPPGVGVATDLRDGVIVKAPSAPVKSYAVEAATKFITSPKSASTVRGIREYPDYASAQAAEGGSNWMASLKTHMQTLGAVTSEDGAPEYRLAVLGANPQVTAIGRGNWPAGLRPVAIVNHIRSFGRGMAPLT